MRSRRKLEGIVHKRSHRRGPLLDTPATQSPFPRLSALGAPSTSWNPRAPRTPESLELHPSVPASQSSFLPISAPRTPRILEPLCPRNPAHHGAPAFSPGSPQHPWNPWSPGTRASPELRPSTSTSQSPFLQVPAPSPPGAPASRDPAPTEHQLSPGSRQYPLEPLRLGTPPSTKHPLSHPPVLRKFRLSGAPPLPLTQGHGHPHPEPSPPETSFPGGPS